MSLLQAELIKVNRIFYKHLHTVKGLTQKVQQVILHSTCYFLIFNSIHFTYLQLTRNVEEMGKMVNTAQFALFQKQQTASAMINIDA